MRNRHPANEKAPPLSSQLKLPNRALVSRGPKLFELDYGDNYAVNAFELHERRPLVSHLIQVTWAILQPVIRSSIFSLFFILVLITYIDVFVQVFMRNVSSRVIGCLGCLRVLDVYAVSYTLLWLHRGFLMQFFIPRWGSGSSKKD